MAVSYEMSDSMGKIRRCPVCGEKIPKMQHLFATNNIGITCNKCSSILRFSSDTLRVQYLFGLLYVASFFLLEISLFMSFIPVFIGFALFYYRLTCDLEVVYQAKKRNRDS